MRGPSLPASALCMAVLLAAAGSALAVDPVADIESQYQTVLEALKHPVTTGVLVTEVGAESAAAAGGMRGGDIIVEYYGNKTTTLEALREQVAEAVAIHLNDDSRGQAALVQQACGRAAGATLATASGSPWGSRAVEVQAGVPGPRNPPPNQRGTLKLDWEPALQTFAEERNSGGAAFRSFERDDPGPPATATALLRRSPRKMDRDTSSARSALDNRKRPHRHDRHLPH